LALRPSRVSTRHQNLNIRVEISNEEIPTPRPTPRLILSDTLKPPPPDVPLGLAVLYATVLVEL
jgi:hypothetical protein